MINWMFGDNLCVCVGRFPLYYEIKIAFVIWLLSPYTRGASLIYRKCLHPLLSSREQVILPLSISLSLSLSPPPPLTRHTGSCLLLFPGH